MTIARIHQAAKRIENAIAITAVREAGGIWVGTMDCPASRDGQPAYTLALFNSRKTGSTLALKTDDITVELVREHIAASDALFTTQRSSILSSQEKI